MQLQKEFEECLKRIAKYEKILSSKKEMAKVIKADLQATKKKYGVARKTLIIDAKAAIYEEKKIEEKPVVFIMDRFGYAKTIDVSAYERNKDAVHAENKYVFSCMNTGKILIFTDTGSMHQVKVLDLPHTRFRDKGTPIDNVGNYDSSGENIVYIGSEANIKNKKLLFATKKGMMKLVDASEFEVNKRTVVATKLSEDDLVVAVYITDAKIELYSKFTLDGGIVEEEVIDSNQHVVVASADGYFLKFPLRDIPQKKKNAIGVRGIKLTKDDHVDEVYLMTDGDEVTVKHRKKEVNLTDIKLAHRDGRGSKLK